MSGRHFSRNLPSPLAHSLRRTFMRVTNTTGGHCRHTLRAGASSSGRPHRNPGFGESPSPACVGARGRRPPSGQKYVRARAGSPRADRGRPGRRSGSIAGTFSMPPRGASGRGFVSGASPGLGPDAEPPVASPRSENLLKLFFCSFLACLPLLLLLLRARSTRGGTEERAGRKGQEKKHSLYCFCI